ncbi:squalene/phytoene synthase family protein [Oceaniovalibus sp. ACAM 378]|uniref:squalene/phytoene synthase family protein n=1 Tax=Oceaniovalibus sp. ACAM 378 TaxID=2599923 RepID=UPI0011D2F687|nr:squalene/phytoene synthase family protein [Oceaniovalibus sp. ACAM 378]TYB91136.1 phytoene synthase [Oceaniovalibus sp. ACAM 378]
MTLQACAEMVKKGDPDRFLAVMAAPPAARAVLFPIYAFNVEVARAPWVTKESMIAEMRLQWWRDALEEIAAGGVLRRHEVVVPLAHSLAGLAADEGTGRLDRLIVARRSDIDSDPFENAAAIDSYLSDTGGGLMRVAASALGAGAEEHEQAQALGSVGAFANYLLAVPALIAAGKQPLPQDAEPWIAEQSDIYLKRFESNRKAQSGALRHAALSVWRARGILRHSLRDPAAVIEGRLQGAEFARRAGLLRAQLFGV